MNKAYKIYKYTKEEGIASTVRRSVRYAKKNFLNIRYPIDVMVKVDDVIAADYIHTPYIKPKKIQKDTLKIAWVLSPLSNGAGGQNTIVRFARYLQKKGHEVTFYIYEGVQAQSIDDARDILRKSFKADITIKKITDYVESDALIATGWETVYPSFNIKTKAHKFYFVQDFEPYFYSVGSRYILAENTYRMNFFGITAGRWLKQKVAGYGMEADYFNFGVDLDIYRLHDIENVQKKKKIAFYARPVTERRAFELGVMVLDLFHKKHPEYEIEFFGWEVSEYRIPFPYVNRGILSHHELAELYQESAACLVLSFTNVSLLPFELLAAGCIPVMNTGENNSLVLGENDYIEYSEASPIELADALNRVVENKSIDTTAKKATQSVDSLSWDDSYEKVEEILLREVTGKKHGK